MAEGKAGKRVFRNETAQQFQWLQRRILGFSSCKAFGSLIESDLIVVVGWKPNYHLKKLIKREKEETRSLPDCERKEQSCL